MCEPDSVFSDKLIDHQLGRRRIRVGCRIILAVSTIGSTEGPY
jgi:hypothetical protein